MLRREREMILRSRRLLNGGRRLLKLIVRWLRVVSYWKFQLLPTQRDVVARGYRMDTVGEAVESEVNKALPYPLRFQKVNKIVACLGPDAMRKDYVEQLGVGSKHWPEFELPEYVSMTEAAKIAALRAVVLKTFRWLEDNLEDAQFVARARAKLPWAT